MTIITACINLSHVICTAPIWLQAGEWVQAQIDSMDPHILTIGKDLEEAKKLRRDHIELIDKLQVDFILIRCILHQ